MIISVGEWSAHGISISENDRSGVLKAVSLDGHDEMTYDLHILGAVGEGGARLRHDGRRRWLKPNHFLLIETKENVSTGSATFGQICSRASLAAKGLIVSNLKVDPNYDNTLYITVFNAGTQDIDLQMDDPFCTLFFMTTKTESQMQARRAPMEPAKSTLRAKLRRAVPIVTFVATVAAGALAAIAATVVMQSTGIIPTK